MAHPATGTPEPPCMTCGHRWIFHHEPGGSDRMIDGCSVCDCAGYRRGARQHPLPTPAEARTRLRLAERDLRRAG